MKISNLYTWTNSYISLSILKLWNLISCIQQYLRMTLKCCGTSDHPPVQSIVIDKLRDWTVKIVSRYNT